MDLLITSETRLQTIQEEFQKRFPFLQVQFFRNKIGNTPDKKPEKISDVSKTFREISGREVKGQIHLIGLMTVTDFEKNFYLLTGIHGEVFRKSRKIWLRTSATDSWTLDEQNHEAMAAENPEYEKPDTQDYHEQE